MLGSTVLLAAAPSRGLVPSERSLAPADLEAADALVCTGSLRLVAPVTAIGARALATAPVVAALRGAVAERVAVDVGIDPRGIGA